MAKLVVPEQQQKDWRLKLELLQSQHKNESWEQQEKHLQQLRLLQQQLLQDVTFCLSTEHHLSYRNIQPPVCEAESEADSIYQSGESKHLRGSTCLPDKIIEDDWCGKKPVTSPNSPSLLRECGNGKRSPPSTRIASYHTTVEGEETENWDIGHKNTFHTHPPPPPPLINGTHTFSGQITKKSTVTIPSSLVALSLSSSPHSMSCANSPVRARDAPHSPKVPLSQVTLPPFFPASCKQACDGPSFQPPSPLKLSSCVPPSPLEKKPCPGAMTQNVLEEVENKTTQSTDSLPFKASLLEKHARHIHDLKTFYESELLFLKERLQKVEQGVKEEDLVTTATRRSRNFDSCVEEIILPVENDSPLSGAIEQVAQLSGRGSTHLEQVRSVVVENGKLEEECCKLQALLNEASRQHHEFVRREELTKEHMGEWQRRCESAGRAAVALQEQLEAVRKEAQEEEGVKERLVLDLQMLTEELQMCRAEGEEDMVKMDRLLHELESVQLENDDFHRMCMDFKLTMEDKNAELASLRKTLIQQKEIEAQDKSKIRNLESEVRRLEHLKNRHHNMGTHYIHHLDQQSLGSVQDHVSPPHSWRQSSGPEHSSGQSYGSVRASTTPSKKVWQAHVDIVDPTPVSTRPLTRQKWLEPSDPALFGVTPTRLGESLLSEGGGGNADAWQRTSTSKTSLSRKRGEPSGRGGVEETRVSGHNVGKVVVDIDMELASSMLQAVKEGRISTEAVKGGAGWNKGNKEMKRCTDEKVRQHLRAAGGAEEKLARLQAEKDKLESAFWRIPGSGAKVNKSAKLAQLEKEKRLEVVRQEIGLTRMILRDDHTLNK